MNTPNEYRQYSDFSQPKVYAHKKEFNHLSLFEVLDAYLVRTKSRLHFEEPAIVATTKPIIRPCVLHVSVRSDLLVF